MERETEHTLRLRFPLRDGVHIESRRSLEQNRSEGIVWVRSYVGEADAYEKLVDAVRAFADEIDGVEFLVSRDPPNKTRAGRLGP